VRNVLRVSSTYRGKANESDLEVSPIRFIAAGQGKKGRERQIAELQMDGTFNIVTQKPKDKGWETASVARLAPTTAEMVAGLGWPDQPAPKGPSFMSRMLNSMKEGALAGFQQGISDGVQSSAQYRVQQITGTPQCRDVGGGLIECPKTK
jgi:hypothetical protein